MWLRVVTMMKARVMERGGRKKRRVMKMKRKVARMTRGLDRGVCARIEFRRVGKTPRVGEGEHRGRAW